MARDIGAEQVREHFTLDVDEQDLLRNKSGDNRLGFALLLKFLLWKGRFPRGRGELADDVVGHVATQVRVAASELGFYDFNGRQVRNHKAEIRRHTGFRKPTVADGDKLAAWLAAAAARKEPRADRVRALRLEHCRAERLEPPTPERLTRILDSGMRRARAALSVTVHDRLDDGQALRLSNLVPSAPTGAPAAETALDVLDEDHGTVELADGEQDEADTDVLAQIKADPGNVSLKTMLAEIDKLEAVRAVGLPAGLFAEVEKKFVDTFRARAAVSAPSHLRRHGPRIRLTYLAALLHQREREITDTLVDLLCSTIHKINAKAEKKVVEAFVAEHKSKAARNLAGTLFKVTEAALEEPKEQVDKVIHPILGGEKAMLDLLHTYKARTGGFARDKRRVFASSYTNHYRKGMIELLNTLEFRSNNDKHQPVLDGIKLIRQYAKSSKAYYPLGTTVRLDDIVKEDWREFAEVTDAKGRDRINRHVYECCVLIALREKIRCKEIWIVGADRWRNPDEDLPADFEANRLDNYRELGLPLDPKEFTAGLRDELSAELSILDAAVPKMNWLTIAERQLGGPIKLTPFEPAEEPRNLRKLKRAIVGRWGTVALIDMLKEAALRTPMLKVLTSIGTRDSLPAEVLFERMLLAYAYGTNSGFRTVAAGDHGHSEDDLRYVAKRYFTPEGLKATAIRTGTATTESILRRFTRNASHPVYQAMLEVGRAQKTIFVCRYLRDRQLQREINAGLNVVEGWNGVNDVIYFGKSGEFASNRLEQQELSLLCLHLLQAALVYVNTLMIQDMLADPEWADQLTAEDRRGLTPLFTSNMTPYGEVKLNMGKRLALSEPESVTDSDEEEAT